VDGLQYHSNILAFFGHNWNLEERLQIIERVGPTRQMQAGKDRPMFIHNIIARDTVDEMVIERVTTKRRVQDILMDAMKVKGYL
jgi:SNF2 family DNA or RNA helicase